MQILRQTQAFGFRSLGNAVLQLSQFNFYLGLLCNVNSHTNDTGDFAIILPQGSIMHIENQIKNWHTNIELLPTQGPQIIIENIGIIPISYRQVAYHRLQPTGLQQDTNPPARKQYNTNVND